MSSFRLILAAAGVLLVAPGVEAIAVFRTGDDETPNGWTVKPL